MPTIELSQGKVAIVDDVDFELLSQFKWTASFGSRSRKWYAIRREKTGPAVNGKPQRRRIAMHRLIMNCPADMVVDHLDGDSLNNTRANLEIVTQTENMRRVATWKQKSREEPCL